jgi:hypothetical protein
VSHLVCESGRIQSDPNGKSKIISLAGNTATVVIENVKFLFVDKDLIRKLFDKIPNKYIEIRWPEY